MPGHYSVDDYEALKRILNDIGTNEHARTPILAAWKEEKGSMAVFSRKALSGAERAEKIRRLTKELGFGTKHLTAEESAARIARRKADIEIRLLERTLEEKDRTLNPLKETPPTPPARAVEMAEIISSANGIAQKLRIPKSAFTLCAPLMVKSNENGQSLTLEIQVMKEQHVGIVNEKFHFERVKKILAAGI